MPTNLVTNPSFEVNTNGWTSAFGGTTLARVAETATGRAGGYAADIALNGTTTPPGGTGGGLLRSPTGVQGMPVGEGRTVSAMGRTRRTNSNPPTSVRFLLQAFNASGAFLMSFASAVVPTTGGYNEGRILGAVTPPGTAYVCLNWYRDTSDDGTAWLAAGSGSLRFDAHMLVEGDTLPPYFDGDTPDDDQYVHEWTGTPHASTSTRDYVPRLVAEVQDTEPPRVQITLQRLPLDGTTVTLWREVEGERTPVRGYLNVTPTSAATVVWDLGAPFGVEVSYVLTRYHPDGTVTETTVGPVFLTAGLPWISHPITGQGVAVTIAEWPEYEYAARQTVVPVAGRPTPIVVSDVRLAATSELTVLTRTRDELLALRELLASGDVLQVRPVCDAVEPDYIAVGDVVEARVKPSGRSSDPRPAGQDWRRRVTMAVQAVEQPAPTIAAVSDTLADLNTYAPTTLADLSTTFGPGATLLTIAQTPLTGAA